VDYESLTKEELIAVLKRRDVTSRYGLRWESDASKVPQDKALNRDFVGLELSTELSVGAGPWQNIIIEADNYDALRHLASTHAKKFHLIYADCPYNTGRKDFVYNDNYFDVNNRYRHSTWLEFMYQRLTLAKHLLRDDGAIVMSIDDNELFNLGLLMNQVFGEGSFVANCIWQKRYSRENREAIGDAHEYLMVYSLDKDKFKARRGQLPLTEEQAKIYKNPDNPKETDPTKRWRGVPMTAQGYRPNQMYSVKSPKGAVHVPPEGRCWGTLESNFLDLDSKGKIYWGKTGLSQPSYIRYLSEVDGFVPWTWWPHEEVGHTDEARKEIQDIFGTQTAFDTPKPTRLMERVIQICAPEKDALILDFFAGSGTTAHAVLRKNAADGGSRRFVLISNREATVDNPEKNLCRDVCAVRVRKAIQGYVSSKTGAVAALGGDFAYLSAARVPMHRLEEGLTDSMIWAFALQACGHPMTEVSAGLSTSLNDTQLICYAANVKTTTLKKLKTAVENHKGIVVLFTWAPLVVTEHLTDEMHRLRVVSVPQDLRQAFKQGNAKPQAEEAGGE
jgi:adenine-specific DNA-methyltransferase